tara:strand:+ start:165 stop:317 length:153 start_codon:yes stop_codon:yes gene_type:complete
MDEASLDEMLLSDSPDKDEYRDKVDSLSPLKNQLGSVTRSTSNFLDGSRS